MSEDNSLTPKLPNSYIPEQRVTSALDSKIEAINKHEEIIWKVRAGYLAILYTGLTLVLGQRGMMSDLIDTPKDKTWVMLFFLIIGFSLSAFLVDYAYLRKKMRIIALRDMLIDATYNPRCTLKDEQLYRLLQVGSERPLMDDFPEEDKELRKKVKWNVKRVLLPIYAATPLLAFVLWLIVMLSTPKH